MTTDVCIYKLQDSRFIEKYDTKANTSKTIIIKNLFLNFFINSYPRY